MLISLYAQCSCAKQQDALAPPHHTHTLTSRPSYVCDDGVQTVPLLVGPLVSEVVTQVQVSEGEADVTTDLCGEVASNLKRFR